MRKYLKYLILSLVFLSAPVFAGGPTVFEHTVKKPMSEVYGKVYKSLEDSRFFVVKEINLGENLASFAKKWGDDYNRNKLTAIRSIIFCNGWYANQVSNKDPKMLGLCPLHITLYEKDGKTTALFNRPTVIARKSRARGVLKEVESEIIAAIKKGMK
ncbi:MAG: DUF302 domain-containing protein [Proteobacteria bacterium]|nr:DUF302 domain-containing protein [Pseudomonadota bacterium]